MRASRTSSRHAPIWRSAWTAALLTAVLSLGPVACGSRLTSTEPAHDTVHGDEPNVGDGRGDAAPEAKGDPDLDSQDPAGDTDAGDDEAGDQTGDDAGPPFGGDETPGDSPGDAQDGGDPCPDCVEPCGCTDATACESQVCVDCACLAPTCTDWVVNGDETDQDCGGSCPPCIEGAACLADSDCASGACSPAGSCKSLDWLACESLDGRWDPSACGNYQCGVPPDCPDGTGGCDCGPQGRFVSGVGCAVDYSCLGPESCLQPCPAGTMASGGGSCWYPWDESTDPRCETDYCTIGDDFGGAYCAGDQIWTTSSCSLLGYCDAELRQICPGPIYPPDECVCTCTSGCVYDGWSAQCVRPEP